MKEISTACFEYLLSSSRKSLHIKVPSLVKQRKAPAALNKRLVLDKWYHPKSLKY